MSVYNITDVIGDMEAALHGTTINQITNPYGLFDRAARDVLSDCDPNETMRFTEPFPLYTGVFDYTCPTDLKGNRIFDIRPQVNRKPWDATAQTFSQNFDRIKTRILQGALVNVNWNQYVKSLNIAVNKQPVLVLNSNDSFNGNGTWVAGTNVSDIATDNLNFATGSGSVSFAMAGSGYLYNSTMTPINMIDQQTVGSLFMWFWMQSPSITSVSLRWGSDASNYWSGTATAAVDNTAFQIGWNLVEFPWPSSATGAPNVTEVNFLRADFVLTGPMNPVRIDAITSTTGTLFEVGYYSKFLFRDSVTGAFQETVTDNSNLLNLDTDSYQIFFNKCMILASQQKQGVDAIFADLPYFENEYNKYLALYQAKYPSQTQKSAQPYYAFRKQSYSRYLGSRRF